MTEVMLRDASQAHGLRHAILRYFNVAGADPKLRSGQSTSAATHLIKLASQAAIGLRPALNIFGTDYPTPDGTCVRDYIHVTDLARAHLSALRYLRAGGCSNTFNCGYGRGSSVLEVVDAIRRVSGLSLDVNYTGRRSGDPACLVADAARIRATLDWTPDYDNLDTIVSHALAWEIRLAAHPESPASRNSNIAA
jgi:UDP-glucose 4-epimerase